MQKVQRTLKSLNFLDTKKYYKSRKNSKYIKSTINEIKPPSIRVMNYRSIFSSKFLLFKKSKNLLSKKILKLKFKQNHQHLQFSILKFK